MLLCIFISSWSSSRAEFLLLYFIKEAPLVPEAVESFQVQHRWLSVLGWLIMSPISVGLQSLVKYPRFGDLQKWQNVSHALCSFTWRTQLPSLELLLNYAGSTCVNILRHTGRLLELLHGRKRINVIHSLELFVSPTGLKMKMPPIKEENFQLLKVGSILMWKWIEHWTAIQETWKYMVVCPFNSVCVI